MTSIDSRCTAASAEAPPPTTGRRKSLLFCPTCEFESSADGNWIVRATADERELVCPDCRSTVATR
ncbi:MULTISPECIES: hypothetical protein [Halomicrobium]|uniref:DUF8106 domain-containing protein n=2 Tax=Halomicrobium mukohataei TaxID=57705 RepID=C7NYC4_HALMD|nr:MULTISPECIES: hypothetical protein [Halomicrobium]ACV48584.1 conserved hypothetical protein [Halomicrobium mukohataei DSM 12286]QCD66982.1 hypothetical protein E5139_15515 [Halomicrobium mukohataei]QFR21792.1 hypothetical protein GBQ70_15535 [Halomicrobium sp. ZPS1]